MLRWVLANLVWLHPLAYSLRQITKLEALHQAQGWLICWYEGPGGKM